MRPGCESGLICFGVGACCKDVGFWPRCCALSVSYALESRGWEWCTFPCCALELPLLVYLRFLRDIADVKVDEGLFSVACYSEVEVPKQSACCKSMVAQVEANK
jgi:hypothetical protein